MKKKVFAAQDTILFRNDLVEFRDWYNANCASTLFFQVLTTELDQARIAAVSDVIEDVFPGVPWFGFSTSGNLVDCEVVGSVVVVATIFEKVSTQFRLFQYDMERMSSEEISRAIIDKARQNPWVKGIEIYRTISEKSSTHFCQGLDWLSSEIQVFGGIVCSPDISSSDSCVFSSEGQYDPHGMLVLFYGGDDFHIQTTKISGWKPLGRKFYVTRAKGSYLFELGGVPAYEIYRKYLNIENDSNFFSNALEFPLLYEHNGTTIVRAPAMSNPDGSIVMSSDIEENSLVRLSYGEPQTIVENIRENAAQIKSFHPEQLRIFSCAARKAFWNQRDPAYELHPLRDIAEATGFFSHGEFIRENGFLNQHNITLVVAAMREGDGPENAEVSHVDDSVDQSSRIPLAARMATFIRETSFELEEINSKLELYNRHLEGVASTDSLTGLENRLAFDELLAKIESSTENKSQWTMLMIDMNGLKYTNDTFGHAAGDSLIISAAECFSKVFTPKGRCFRIGGDEFVVIIEANVDEMYRLRKDLDDVIADYNKNALYRLSVSVGECRLVNEKSVAHSISDWKMGADLAMYRNKVLTHRKEETGENKNLRELVSCLISIEEAKDSYTANHSDRVQALSNLLANALGLSDVSKQLISDAALLHDIGKVGVSDAILGKPGKLTAEEFAVIKQHTVIGAHILMQSNYTQEMVQVVLHHHERYDGKGYPEGLAGEDIPLGSRIIAIADSIDAMTSRRCYRDALSLDFCREEIEKNLGLMYDPAIGKVALEHWGEITDELLKMFSGSSKQS